MEVVVRIGVTGRSGKVRVGGEAFKARRAGRDSWTVAGPEYLGPSRVRYSLDGRLAIEGPAGRVDIRFHPELTTFTFDNREYAIGNLQLGRIVIRDGDRVAARGHGTSSGIRLDSLEPDLEPIARELALGLALRTYDLDREYRTAPGGSGE